MRARGVIMVQGNHLRSVNNSTGFTTPDTSICGSATMRVVPWGSGLLEQLGYSSTTTLHAYEVLLAMIQHERHEGLMN